MKLSRVALAIQAQLIGNDGDLPPIAIDSRKIQGGELFVALGGENFDGHDFIDQAIQKGAKVILTARPLPQNKNENVSFLYVKDTTKALGELAKFHRSHYPIPMVGITGSCGKTTVKGMIEGICQRQGQTLATSGNFNNHIGLPLTLMRLNAAHQFAVIEMGANHPGEIEYLGGLAQPTVTLITNVAPAHLQGFGTIDGVAKAKGEIYEILPEKGIAVLNIDDSFHHQWQQQIGNKKTITYGLSTDAMVTASNIHLQPFAVTFTLHSQNLQQTVTLNIPGKHTVMNALAAAAAGLALGVHFDNVIAGLEAFEGVKGRMQRYQGFKGAWVIDDTYNANPGSMYAALEVLGHCEGQKIFVMGDMGELGENAIAYHTQVGHFARQKGVARLLAVGKLTEHAVNAFGIGGKMYPNKQTLVEELKNELKSEMTILVKGSRSAGMEVVSHALIHHEEVL